MGNVGGKDVSHTMFSARASISLTSPKYPLQLLPIRIAFVLCYLNYRYAV